MSELVRDEPIRDAVSRGLAFLALMVSLLSLGAAGWVYYRAIWSAGDAGNDEIAKLRDTALEGDRKLDQRVVAIESALAEQPARSGEDAPRSTSELARQLDERFAAERERIDGSVERLQSALGSALAATPPTTVQWKLAEAEYLLRVGNHRVLMERDAHGAAPLFRAADDVIKDVDDAGLVPVRAKLADEIAALETVARPDVDGAFVRIEALKKRIAELPLRLPEYKHELETAAPPASAPAAAASWWERAGSRFVNLVRIRNHSSEGLKPMLDPVEAGYLEMNLELALERAQLALLRDDPTLFGTSLDSARRLLDAHLDPESEAVRRFRGELDSVGTIELGASLPDVSGSLRLLREAARSALRHDDRDDAQ
jgi:uroporphyrin-3 C-methyltransferase